MPELIYNANSPIVPYTFILATGAILYLLFSQKTIWVRIFCIAFLSILTIQVIIGFGGDAIIKAIFGNKIISVFEGTVNPPDASPILVKRYESIQTIFFIISIWISPIALIGIAILLLINQILSKAKLKIIIIIILGVFAISFFIESISMIIGIHGKVKL